MRCFSSFLSCWQFVLQAMLAYDVGFTTAVINLFKRHVLYHLCIVSPFVFVFEWTTKDDNRRIFLRFILLCSFFSFFYFIYFIVQCLKRLKVFFIIIGEFNSKLNNKNTIEKQRSSRFYSALCIESKGRKIHKNEHLAQKCKIQTMPIFDVRSSFLGNARKKQKTK